ncbi:MAG: hypothetical protein HPY44_04130 [Armatimonadetes bacterium]|nr:hypothetical protein [Armatimonadota bacterium]
MTAEDFRRIMTAFASRPTDVDMEGGQFLVELRDETIHVKLRMRQGLLVVEEEGSPGVLAEEWIENRVAVLPLLADRILSYIDEVPYYVTPSGELVDSLDVAPSEDPIDVADATAKVTEVLGRRPAGTTSVLYLTSDAGEGKTSLIHQVARRQAEGYKAKTPGCDWLLLPVSLGGRTLLRFDDVMVASLMNRLRFQYWYYDGLVELVRMGLIVIALDGFEELFLDTSSGEAVSNLSGFIRALHGDGTLLVAARKAYFEYSDLGTQARLFDALRPGVASFAKMGLHRWQRQHFVSYCMNRRVPDGEIIYQDVAESLDDPDHPLLTRAVLVEKLVDVASEASDRRELLSRVGSRPHDFLGGFISTIVDREVGKWIDRDMDPHVPLLTREQHYGLLGLVADEMWTGHTDRLGQDVVSLLTDVFCESEKLGHARARQVKERTKEHALLRYFTEGNRPFYEFDHQQFRDFFIGWEMAKAIANADADGVRRLFSANQMPADAADAVVDFARSRQVSVPSIRRTMQQVLAGSSHDLYTAENCGAVLIRVLNGVDGAGTELADLVFPQDAFGCCRKIRGVVFARCRFQPTALCFLDGCTFTDCTFERAELLPETQLQGVCFRGTEVRSLRLPGNEALVYDPEHIRSLLHQQGVHYDDGTPVGPPPDDEVVMDESLRLAHSAIRTFRRSTYIHEDVLRLKLHHRHKELLEELLKAGILEDTPPHPGTQRFLQLAVPMSEIEAALEGCRGSFERFISMVSPQ